MTESQKIELRRSKVRERLAAISKLEGDAYTDEVKTEERSLQDEYGTLETRYRSAMIAEDKALEDAKADAGDDGLDKEARERIELRSKASVSKFFQAFARGRMVDGPEAELQAAAGVSGIPIEVFEPDPRAETRSAEQRAVTPAPGTVGVNLDPIRPAVFANSIAARLGIDMPRVASGTYATGTITTSTTAGAVGKGDVSPETAAAITVQTATPKRVSARLALRLEDIAAVGQQNFESILRQNLSLALSDELDDQAINGDGAGDNLTGILARLTDPTAPTAVPAFDDFVKAFANGIDGLWANTVKDVGIVVGVDTYRLSARTFRDRVIDTGNRGGVSLGDESFADYAMRLYGGWWTNARMPSPASNDQAGILYRKGRSAMGASAGMRTAVCPHWGEISIDDIYSGSARAERYFTMHVLLGDVILVQPAAYAQVAFQVA